MTDKNCIENGEIFRREFVEFESLTKDRIKKYGGKFINIEQAINFLYGKKKNPYYSQYQFLDFCRYVRNNISHTNTDAYLVYTNELLEKLQKIIDELVKPYDVYSKSIKNVYSRDINDSVKDTMLEMKKMNYTHIPIYENNKLVGVFSESTLFQYLLDNDEIILDLDTKFSDIREAIDLDKSNEIIKFVKRDELYDDVVEQFVKEYNKHQKLSCIMITQNGKRTEKVIGILTTWDVIGEN